MLDDRTGDGLRERETWSLSEAHAAVLEQNKKGVFDPVPYERATELLELLQPVELVDDRVQLALDITLATRDVYRPDLSRRALYAALPAGSTVKDLTLKRKWFTFAGIIEGQAGNVERALKYKLIALGLCEQLKDSLGYCTEWSNFSNLASGAGLYRDAVRYATVAAESEYQSNVGWLEVRCGALACRANALMRLGHFAAAESDLVLILMTTPHPLSASRKHWIFMAQYLFAELQIERGDMSSARAVLLAASTWAGACDIPRYALQIERVRARLSAFDSGIEQAASTLTSLLATAHNLEAQLGESANEDVVLDVLHTLERIHREHDDVTGANRWLKAIGDKLRANATKMLDALSDKPLLSDETKIAAKMAEVDEHLQLKLMARSGGLEAAAPSWIYLVGLAASATSIEDPTKEHGVRVARLAGFVSRELGLPEAMQRGIEAGCLVHDVGKVSVPSSILGKQAPLSADELQMYNAHPDVGAGLVERLKHLEQSVVRNVVRFHHHPYFGDTRQSLPMGEAIPLEARIASVCDEYDSLITGRPRRPAISSDDALLEIFEHRSRKFDPKVVDVFVEIVRRLQRTHPNLQTYLSEEADGMEYFAMHRTLQRAAERADDRLSASRT